LVFHLRCGIAALMRAGSRRGRAGSIRMNVCSLALGVALLAGVPVMAQSEAPAPTTQPSQPAGIEAMSNEEIVARARELIRRGVNLDDAQRALRFVFTRSPEFVDARVALAELAEAMQDSARAREIYQELLNKDPNNFAANLGMGKAYLGAGWARQATRYLERAALAAPSERKGEALALLSQSYLEERKADKAAEAAEQAVQAAPDSVQARTQLAVVRYQLRQFNAALDDARALVTTARKQLESDPGNAQLLSQLARAYELLAQVLSESHRALYQTGSDGKPTDRIRPGKEKEAAALLKQLVETGVTQSEVRRVQTYHGLLALAERAVQYDPENVSYLLDYGYLLYQTSQPQRAAEVFQRVLQLDSNNLKAREQLEAMGAPLTSQPALPPGTPP